jgi:hypothetical protein
VVGASSPAPTLGPGPNPKPSCSHRVRNIGPGPRRLLTKLTKMRNAEWQAVAMDLDIEWSGPATDWIGSIGTALAFLVAAIGYVGSVRDKRREQASQVSAWIQPSDSDPAHRELRMLNGSRQPVFDLYLPAGGKAEPLVPQALPPGPPIIVPTSDSIGGPDYRLPTPMDIVFVDAADREWHRLGKRHRLRRCRWWHRHKWLHGRNRKPAMDR